MVGERIIPAPNLVVLHRVNALRRAAGMGEVDLANPDEVTLQLREELKTKVRDRAWILHKLFGAALQVYQDKFSSKQIPFGDNPTNIDWASMPEALVAYFQPEFSYNPPGYKDPGHIRSMQLELRSIRGRCVVIMSLTRSHDGGKKSTYISAGVSFVEGRDGDTYEGIANIDDFTLKTQAGRKSAQALQSSIEHGNHPDPVIAGLLGDDRKLNFAEIMLTYAVNVMQSRLTTSQT